MLALSEKQVLLQEIGRCIYVEIQKAIAPIEKALANLPKPKDGIDGAPGKDGKDGTNGKDAEIPWDELNEQLQAGFAMLTKQMHEKINALPKPERGEKGEPGEKGEQGPQGEKGLDGAPGIVGPQGEKGDQGLAGEKGEKGDQGIAGLKGEPGKDGKDGKDGRDGIDGPAGPQGERGEKGEAGKDGQDGRDGIDGKSLALDDVRDLLHELVVKAVGNIPIPRNCTGGHIDRAGHLYLEFSDGCKSDLGEVVGRDGKDIDPQSVAAQIDDLFAKAEKPKDGKDGKDGLDGVGFDDLELEWDGERLVTFKFVKGENAKVFHLSFPVPLDKGFWKQGEYFQADMVQRDGSMWIATKDTRTVPGTPNSDWRLCAKRGRDGKPGEKGPVGPAGKDGRAGRDLTQIGPDGKKW